MITIVSTTDPRLDVIPGLPLDRFDVAVDSDAEPLDVDRLLDALDQLVERRLAHRHTTTADGAQL